MAHSPPLRRFPPTPASGRIEGFTLVELITVMIIVGIIAVVAIPRFADRLDFDARGFTDEVRAALQYARKTAVVSRRYVCVAADGTGVTFTRDPANFSGAPSCSANLNMPGAASSCNAALNKFCTPANISFSSTSASFYFDAQGQSSAAATLAVSVGTIINTIAVEQATGYVH